MKSFFRFLLLFVTTTSIFSLSMSHCSAGMNQTGSSRVIQLEAAALKIGSEIDALNRKIKALRGQAAISARRERDKKQGLLRRLGRELREAKAREAEQPLDIEELLKEAEPQPEVRPRVAASKRVVPGEKPEVTFADLRKDLRTLTGSAYVEAVQMLQDIIKKKPQTLLRSQVKQLLSTAAGPVQATRDEFQASVEQRAAAEKLFNVAIEAVQKGTRYSDRKSFTQSDLEDFKRWQQAASVKDVRIAVYSIREKLGEPATYRDGINEVAEIIKNNPEAVTLMGMKKLIYDVAKPLLTAAPDVDAQERAAALDVLQAAAGLADRQVKFRDGKYLDADDKKRLEKWIQQGTPVEKEVLAEVEPAEAGPVDAKAIYKKLRNRKTYDGGAQELAAALKNPGSISSQDVERVVTMLAQPVIHQRVNDEQREAALEIFKATLRLQQEGVQFADGRALPSEAGGVLQGWITAATERAFKVDDVLAEITNPETFEQGVQKVIDVLKTPTEITLAEVEKLTKVVGDLVVQDTDMTDDKREKAADLFAAVILLSKQHIRLRDNKPYPKESRPQLEKWLAAAEERAIYEKMSFVAATMAKLRRRETYVEAVRDLTTMIVQKPQEITTDEIEKLLIAVARPVRHEKVDLVQLGLAMELFQETKTAVEKGERFKDGRRLPDAALSRLKYWMDNARRLEQKKS